jgi:hypothetical protein
MPRKLLHECYYITRHIRQANKGVITIEKLFFIVYYAMSNTFFPNQFSACAVVYN